jgi:hypothetical protein
MFTGSLGEQLGRLGPGAVGLVERDYGRLP